MDGIPAHTRDSCTRSFIAKCRLYLPPPSCTVNRDDLPRPHVTHRRTCEAGKLVHLNVVPRISAKSYCPVDFAKMEAVEQ